MDPGQTWSCLNRILASPPNDFIVQVNGIAVTYLGETYSNPMLDASRFADFYARDAGPTENISQLENDSYSFEASFTANVYGIAIDLDDFDVAPLGMVSTVQFGGVGEVGNNTVDPMLFMGIRSATATVPEPSTFSLAALVLLGVGCRRRQRV
jgi:hypothetical protein